MIRLGGYCFCGDAQIIINQELFLSNFDSMENSCNIPCIKDPNLSCGGDGYSLVYQKPVDCFHGFLNHLNGNFYCMQPVPAIYSDAEVFCQSLSTNRKILNAIEAQNKFEFMKEWITDFYSSNDSATSSFGEFSIWAGRLSEFNDNIPEWITWENGKNPSPYDAVCVRINVFISLSPSTVQAFLDVVDCNSVKLNYICDLGNCDGEGYCSGSKNADKIGKELTQTREFVTVQSISWDNAREICLQQNKDLCQSEDICENSQKILIEEDVIISISKNLNILWVPSRGLRGTWNKIDLNNSRCYSQDNIMMNVSQTSKNSAAGIFCCGKHQIESPNSKYERRSIPATRKTGPIKLSTYGSSVSLKWIDQNDNICCSNCFLATSQSNLTTDAYFYKISSGLLDLHGTVSFEMVDAPGYFLKHCIANGSYMVVATHWEESEEATFWSSKEENCRIYESHSVSGLYLSLDSQLASMKERNSMSSEEFLKSACFGHSQEFHRFEVDPAVQTWHYSRDFCNTRGMDLCDSETVCQDQEFGYLHWLPVRNFESQWVFHSFSKECYSHTKQYTSPAYQWEKQGVCGPWDTSFDSVCYFKKKLHCCDSISYTIDNVEDPPLELDIEAFFGNAIEYGYLDANIFDQGVGSGNLNEENISEELCYQKTRLAEYSAYGFLSNLSSCFGITKEEFKNFQTHITMFGDQESVKIVKINYHIKDKLNNTHAASTINSSNVKIEEHFPTSFLTNLTSFTISIWYQDNNKLGVIFLTYIDPEDYQNIFLIVKKLKEDEGFIVSLCGKELLFVDDSDRSTSIGWHHLIIQLIETSGIHLNIDGKPLFEEAARNVENECYLSLGGDFTHGYLDDINWNGDKAQVLIIIDMWNNSMVNEKTLYEKPNKFGNLITSAVNEANLENSFIVPSSFLKLSRWTKDSTSTFKIHLPIDTSSDQKFSEMIVKNMTLGSWASGNEVNNNMKSCLLTPPTLGVFYECLNVDNFDLLPTADGQYAIKFQPKYDKTPLYLLPINLGNESFGFQTSKNIFDNDTLIQFYHQPSLFELSSLKNSSRDDLHIFTTKSQEWKLQGANCEEILPVNFAGSLLERVHLNYHPRRCLQFIWKNEIGCTVPLFRYGSFFDNLLERWRNSAKNGGLRQQHIRELMQYAFGEAKKGNLKYYKVCFGGYNIRLLRISQQLKSTVTVPPSENIRSGLLQSYDTFYGWGGVCIKHLVSNNFADVACRELGYSKSQKVFYTKINTLDKISVKNLICFGNESSLQECRKDKHMHCDEEQLVHITCKIESNSCSDGWVLLHDNICVSEALTSQESSDFESAKESCEVRGGIILELPTDNIASLLKIYLNNIKVTKVWLGVHLDAYGNFKWRTSGKKIDVIATASTKACVEWNINSDKLKAVMCTRNDIGGICIKPLNCSEDFKGLLCQLVECPIQDLPGVKKECSPGSNNIHSQCSYECENGKTLIGPSIRECIMSKENGPIWNDVFPICSASSNASDTCTESKACGNGICIEVSIGLYRCVCDKGFFGYNCQFSYNKTTSLPVLTVDPCEYIGCKNYGSCLNIGDNKFKCLCIPGYSGKYCEKFTRIICDLKPCLNGGKCIQTGDKSFICRCVQGFTGSTCGKYFSTDRPAECSFPFKYKNTTYAECTSIDVELYKRLGCWKMPIIISDKVFIKYESYDASLFREQCYQQVYESGYPGFAVVKLLNNLLCMSSPDILSHYSKYDKTIKCEVVNQSNAEVYEILYSKEGTQWCSMDYLYDGRFVTCDPPISAYLLRSNPIIESTFVSKKLRFMRGTSWFHGHAKLMTYISDVLSCVQYGKVKIPVIYNISSNVPIEQKQISTCIFPTRSQNIMYFSCIKYFDISQNLTPMCYTDESEFLPCLENYTQYYMPCSTESGHVGYSLTTLFEGNSATEHECVFPFTHEGQEIKSCKLGWCYTDIVLQSWKYCIQDICSAYPQPPTSVESDFKNVVEKEKTCSELNHLYFGRYLTHYSCENACQQHAECLSYIYMPEFEIFFNKGALYSQHDVPSTYNAGHEHCKNMGGSLIKLNDEDTYNFLVSVLKTNEYWINDSNGGNLFAANTYSFESRQWLRNESNENLHRFICHQDASEDILESYLLGKIPEVLGYCIGLKERHKIKQLKNKPNPNDNFQPWWGWKRESISSSKSGTKLNVEIYVEPHTGRRWSISTKSAIWEDAQKDCQSYGGHLAIIDSSEMERYLKQLLKKTNNRCDGVYIGLNTEFLEWVDQSFVYYHNLEKFPSDSNSKCVVIKCASSTPLNYIPCTIKKHFICEFPAQQHNALKDFQKIELTNVKARIKYSGTEIISGPIAASDISSCANTCIRSRGISDCRIFLFDGSNCLLTNDANNVELSVDNGTFDYYEKYHNIESCHSSLLGIIGIFYVNFKQMIPALNTEKLLIHDDSNKNYCFGSVEQENEIVIDIDLTLPANITLIQIYTTMHSFYNMLISEMIVFEEVTMTYGIIDSNEIKTSFNFSQKNLIHPFDVPIIAQHVKFAIPFIGTNLIGDETICVKFDLEGCPLQSQALDKFPHGYYPPSPKRDENKITEDTITINCGDEN
uniref:uncharacterized protein LOC120326766 n=1 Tax=Styela clava TaxID=7725 RepID=UPI00193ACFEE|nr:uncharacterized protein LOC120326766 [Styela clava]